MAASSDTINKNKSIHHVRVTVTFWACIREVLGSNVGWNPGYPDLFAVLLTLSMQTPG
jgi:hypothetical protein